MSQLNAKRTAIRFFDAWKNKDWDICLSYVQITWKRSVNSRDRGFLNRVKNVFGGGRRIVTAREQLIGRLEGFDIAKIQEVQLIKSKGVNKDVIQDAVVSVSFKDGSKGKIQARLVCEKGAYKADPDGIWGVNPNSIRPL